MTAAPAINEVATIEAFDATRPYALHPKVALRPEPFGAMAYHYGNRRLNFLRHHDLVSVVKGLPQYPSIDATLAGVGIAETRRPSFRSALSKLAASEFIVPRPASPSTPTQGSS